MLNDLCLGIHIIDSGEGNPNANGKENSNYDGWIKLAENEVRDGRGQGSLFIEGSKVVSGDPSDSLKRDEILEHQEQKAIYLKEVTLFEAYWMKVTTYGPYGGIFRTPNALYVSGTAHFQDSTFEALTAHPTGGGGLVVSNLGGSQTFERVEVNQLYPQSGVYVNGGSVFFKDSFIPKVGFQSPNIGVLVYSQGIATIENTRIRGYSAGIRLGMVGVVGAAASLTVKDGTDIQSGFYGIYLQDYTGTVLIENNNIHDCTTTAASAGILHEDDNVDGTTLISDNTISDNKAGIKVLEGSPEIKDNTIQSNEIGINIIGGAPHIYGGAGTGDGNVITGNTQYGIYIAAGADVNNLNIEWNDIHGNSLRGIEAEDPGGSQYFYGKCNWWGDANGPDDDSPLPPDVWDNDPGQDVSNYFWYRDPVPPPSGPQLWWLQEPMQTASVCEPPP